MNAKVTVEEWVAMFTEIGLTQETMMQWHRAFETRHPEGHQSFLDWLGLPADRAAEIRQRSR